MSTQQAVDIGDYKFGFKFPDQSVFKTRRGLDEEVVTSISEHKNEPEWMRKFRLRSYQAFLKKSMPNWGVDLSGIDFDNIYYYAKPEGEQQRNWDRVLETCVEGGTIEGVIKGRVKGGVIVDIGVDAFLPGSQVDVVPVRNLDAYMNKSLEFKVLKIRARYLLHIVVDFPYLGLVQVDTLIGGMPYAMPVRIFKSRLRCQSDTLKLSKVRLKSM